MSKKVLIVEDNELIAYLHEKFVIKCGGTVIGKTHNFEEFKHLVNTEAPDVILMDILLGQDKDGVDFVMSIPDCKARIVYVSGSTDPLTLEKLKNTIYHSFVVKPLMFDTLTEILRF